MPLGYGGGVKTVEQAKNIFRIGYEKIIVNSLLFDNPEEVKKIVDFAGSQSVVASIDYKRNQFGKTVVMIHGGRDKTRKTVSEVIGYAKKLGVGEMILTSIDHEGRMAGYDLKIMKNMKSDVPLILNGGAGKIEDIKAAIDAGADASAGSSFFVYFGRNKAVLINTPEEKEYYEAGIFEE